MAKRRSSKQVAASRRNLVKARASRKRKIVIGVAVMGAATGAYAVDRKLNTMNIYHGTTHARARRIHTEGFQPKHRRRAYGNIVDGTLHEAGRVFVATDNKRKTRKGKVINNRNMGAYGPAIVTARVRKSKFRKYATQDVHPLSNKIFAMGGGGTSYANHYHIPHSKLKKAGVKFKYTKKQRKIAKRKIEDRRMFGDPVNAYI